MNNCPCGRSKTYENCCGAIHQNIELAFTAEDLMRSRYSAFVKGNGDYLYKSHSENTRKESEKKDIERWAKSVQWMNLDVLNTNKGSKSDKQGTVEFKAFFIEGGKLQVIHENSFFSKENGHWVYVSAL